MMIDAVSYYHFIIDISEMLLFTMSELIPVY